MELHPAFIQTGGKRYVQLPIKEFDWLWDYKEDLEDSLSLFEARKREGDAPGITLDEFKRRMAESESRNLIAHVAEEGATYGSTLRDAS